MIFFFCFCIDGPDIKSVALNLLEGGTLKSHYLVEGNPTPSVKWMKDGRRIDPSIPLSRNDTGQYVVEAEGASSVKRKLQVFVMCECHVYGSSTTI